MNEPKAKVFISCGQRKESDEITIANRVADELKKLGYDPYIATQQQTLKGLKENVFQELSSSEYFLFIDFKREKLDGGENCRGSLFSHQELAIASFRETPVIAFQEQGAKKDDGIMQFIQANCKTFSNRNSLFDEILKEVAAKWHSNWKNQLSIELAEETSDRFAEHLLQNWSDDWIKFDKTATSFEVIYFYLRVKNLNPLTHCRNCYAFLEKIEAIGNSETVRAPSFELKWRAHGLPNATILPESFRDLDAFFVDKEDGNKIKFSHFWKSRNDKPLWGLEGILQQHGECKLTYLVVSDNFDPVRATFRLKLSNYVSEIEFELVQPEPGTRNA